MGATLGIATLGTAVDLEGLDEGLDEGRGKTEGWLSSLGGSVSSILGGAVLGGVALVTGVVIGIGAAAFTAGTMVDDAMDTIVIATGATGDELAGLEESFGTVFSSVPTDAETAATVIGTLNSRLGLTGDALNDAAIPLAQVTEMLGGDASTNAQTFSDIISKFNIPAEDASTVLDGLFVASQESGVGFDTLSQKVAQFATPLQLMGLSLNESIALLAGMEKAGLNTESVMTGLSKASAKFAEEGVSLADGLAGTIEAIQNAGTAEEALNIAVETFGVKAGPEMLAAIQDGTFAFDDMLAAIQDADGAIMDTAAQTADFGEMMTILKNKATLALAPIGAILIDLANKAMPLVEVAFAWFEETLLPVIEQVAMTVGEFVGTFITNLQAGQSPIEAFRNALAQFIPPETMAKIDEIIGKVVEFAGHITTFVSGHAEEIKGALIAIGAVLAGAGIASTIAGVVAAVAALANPVGLIVLAVGVLGAAWAGNWGGIRDILTEFWVNTAKPILEQVWAWLSVNVPIALEALRAFWVDVAWPAIQGALELAWSIILPISTAVWTWIGENLPAALETLRAFWVETAWPAIQTAITTVWPIIETIFTTLRDWVVNTLIPTIQELYQRWTTEWWPQIQTALENAWTIIEGIFTEVGRWVNDNIVPWLEFLAEKWTEEWWPNIEAALQSAWDNVILPIWEALQEWLGVVLPPIIEGLQTVFEGVMSGISTAVQPVKDLWDDLVGAVQSFWNWITSHTFDFSISIPDLPDWAIPGSPIPLHTAWEDFGDYLRQEKFEPRLGFALASSLTSPDSSQGDSHLRSQQQTTIYGGAHIYGVQDGMSLLEQLQGMT